MKRNIKTKIDDIQLADNVQKKNPSFKSEKN